jgi:branched-chain amino acid transport system permease protein
MTAVSDDPLAASLVGIDTERITSVALFLGSAAAGTGGLLNAMETTMDPAMGFQAVLKAIICCIVGGLGSVPGAAAAAFALGIIENVAVWKLQAGWKDTVAFLFLIAFLLAQRAGLPARRKRKGDTAAPSRG